MAAGTGKSGREVAEDNVQALVSVLSGYGQMALPRYNGELNRTKLAERDTGRRTGDRDLRTRPRACAVRKPALGGVDGREPLHIGVLRRGRNKQNHDRARHHSGARGGNSASPPQRNRLGSP